MPAFEITSPDGKKYRVEGPPGSTKEQALAQLQSSLTAKPNAAQQPVAQQPAARPDTSRWGNIKASIGDSTGLFLKLLGVQAGGAVGLTEAAANVGTGMAAFPVQAAGSLYGMATAKPGERMIDARRNINAVTDAMVYQPRTSAGKALAGGAGAVLGAPARLGDYLGERITEATGSPGLGAATTVGVQAIPIIAGAAYASKMAAARKATGAGTNHVAAHVTPEERAQAYVASRTGLDWNSLSDKFREKITKIAEDAKNLDSLDGAAVERQGRLDALGIRGTRGQITRDAAQLRNEGNVSATGAGIELRKLYAEQNKKIIENLEGVKRGTGGVAESAEQVGRSVQDTALRAKEAASKKNYQNLYAKARATEPGAQVAPDPLFDFLDSNPEVQHTGWLGSWLKRAKIESAIDTGGIEVSQRRPVTLAELHDLRTKATAIARTGGTDGFYAGEVVKSIDAAMEQVPGAAKAWKGANAAFKAHKMEFAEQGAVAQLVENASRTDRAVALENTWRKTVIGGSAEDLANVRKSLTTGTDPKIVAAGKQAWRDLGAQTVQHIIDEATKSVTRLEDGTPNVTPAAMERAIKSVGYNKLNTLFGPDAVAKIKAIMEATRDLKTEPPTGFKGSPTFANLITFMEKRIGWLPGGDMVTGTVRAAAKVREMGASGRQVRNALADPVAEAAVASKNNLASGARRNALSQYGTGAAVGSAERNR